MMLDLLAAALYGLLVTLVLVAILAVFIGLLASIWKVAHELAIMVDRR